MINHTYVKQRILETLDNLFEEMNLRKSMDILLLYHQMYTSCFHSIILKLELIVLTVIAS
jgi:hypothetical protein